MTIKELKKLHVKCIIDDQQFDFENYNELKQKLASAKEWSFTMLAKDWYDPNCKVDWEFMSQGDMSISSAVQFFQDSTPLTLTYLVEKSFNDREIM